MNSYDRIPYHSHPFRQSHLDRLATIATLFGLSPAPIEKGRVLELGCASGGNLLPMAEQLPESTFLGIDGSLRQIADGQQLLAKAGLTNIQLRQCDILDFPLEPNSFDYIISHGVYSWVPDNVQQKILGICGKCLSPNGIAYISYNTYPGWRMRGMIRDIMRYRARSFESPEMKLAQARGLLEFLSSSMQGEENAYSLTLKSELNLIAKADDNYLLHDHLEETNEPVYFHTFMERASAQGLQYLGEADYGVMAVENFPERVQSMLQSVASDIIETEQYMDFLRNRAFRQTLLCPQGQLIQRKPQPSQLLKLRVASSSSPEGEVSLQDESKAVFRRGSSVLHTSNRVVKAAMLHLRKIWPQSIPFVELTSIAHSMTDDRPSAISTDVLSSGSLHLAETMLRCFATAQVDLHVSQPSFVTTISDKPAVSALARAQAENSASVTNRLHETVSLDDFQRQVLCALDGTRDTDTLVNHLVERISSGQLLIYREGQRMSDPELIRKVVTTSLPEALEFLRRVALLVA